ncbi:MAG: hypothetical protein AAF762_00205 [Pseudomonadota bacterium]
MIQLRRLIFRRRTDNPTYAEAEAAFMSAFRNRGLIDEDVPAFGFQLTPWLASAAHPGKLVIGLNGDGLPSNFAPGHVWLACMSGRAFSTLRNALADLDAEVEVTALSWRGHTVRAQEIGWLQQINGPDLYAALEAEGMPTHRWAGDVQ